MLRLVDRLLGVREVDRLLGVREWGLWGILADMGNQIFRDPYGIPHLWADSVNDLAFLQGSNAATDRAWQIELEWWRCQGRTAERLGPVGLPWDRFARRAGLAETAQRAFERLDERTRLWCEAYVDGVNATLSESAERAPEFAALQAKPSHWPAWAPLGLHLSRHVMFSTFADKLWREHVSSTIGEEALKLFVVEGPVESGSNAWALSGAFTASGLPLVAGDPHRILDLPGSYQQVRLACPDFDVVGLAFPGQPGVPHFGHTGDVAWAVTNAQADYQDLYREELRRDGDTVLARDPEGWSPAHVRTEQIAVLDDLPETVDVITTARGPVIIGGPGTDAYSLRTPSMVEDDLGFAALLPLLESHTVDDVAQAWSHWVEPVNCVLTADRSGAVRNLLAGRVPVRSKENRRLPVPAWDPSAAWSGTYEKLTDLSIVDRAVNANDRASGGDLGITYAAPHRAQQIRGLLGDRAGLDVNDMASIHRDATQLGAKTMRSLLADADLSGTASALRDRLIAWDGQMDGNSTEATTFSSWRSALTRRLASNPVVAPAAAPTGLPDLFATWTALTARTGLAWETMIKLAPSLGIDVHRIAAAALVEVAAAEPSLAWSDAHQIVPVYALAGHGWARIPQLSRVQLSGDNNCVLATAGTPGVTDHCSRGSVARYVWDLADRDASRWITPFGASGVPRDAHFEDQLPLWAAGELIPVVTDWNQLTREA